MSLTTKPTLWTLCALFLIAGVTLSACRTPDALAPSVDQLGLSGELFSDRLVIRSGNPDGIISWSGKLQLTLIEVPDTTVATVTERIGPDLTVILPLAKPLDQDPRLYSLTYRYTRGRTEYQGTIALSRLLPVLRLRVIGDHTLIPGATAALRVIALDADGETPLADAEVTITLVDGDRRLTLAAAATGDGGTLDAEFRVPETVGADAKLVITATHGRATATVEQKITLARSARVYLTTDKPLYQPGQTIHLRALALARGTGRAAGGRPVTLEIEDPEGNKVFRREKSTDEYGLAAADFQLADRINLGTYRLRIILDGATTEKTVTVDRYVLPKFAVNLMTDRAYYQPGDRLHGTISSRYFFGKPVSGKVTISLGVFDAGFHEAARAEGRTDGEGGYVFDLDLPRRFAGQPLLQGNALVQLKITVRDSANQEVVITRTRIVSADPLKVTVVPESGEVVPGLENRFFCLVAYPDGSPAAGARVSIRGGLEAELVADSAGIAQFSAIPRDASALHLTARDDRGNSISTDQQLTAATGDALLLRPSAAILKVGDTLRLTLHTARQSGYGYFDLIRDGQTVMTKSAPIERGQATLETTLTREHAGTLIANAYIVGRDGTMVRDTRLLQVQDAGELTVKAQADRAVYAPGSEAAIDFTVTDAAGQPVTAALGIAIVDEAVFALAEAEPGLARVFFAIEKELLQPRFEIHGLSPECVIARASARGEVLLSAAVKTVAPTVDRDTVKEALAAVRTPMEAALARHTDPIFTALAAWLQKEYPGHAHPADLAAGSGDAIIRKGLAGDTGLPAAALTDPWGTPYRFAVRNYEMIAASAGPDAAWGTADDVAASRGVFDLLERRRAGRGGEDEFRRGDGILMAFAAAIPTRPMPATSPTVTTPAPRASAQVAAGENERGGAEPVRIREFFPETLLWEPALITDGRGRARLDFRVADSITDWRMAVSASGRDGQLGGLTAPLRVFQDFFVDLDLPVSFTQGDRISVSVAVYNYLEQPQRITLSLAKTDWFEFVYDDDGRTAAAGVPGSVETRVVELQPGEVKSVSFPIALTGFGRHDFTITADGEKSSDAVRRSVEVLPNGRRFTTVENGRLSADATATLAIPGNAIAGASELILKIYPGTFSQIVEGLDGIFRMPSGCFEQTTSTTYPNVIALNYLRTVKRSAPELELKAENYINLGYQRLVSFEVPGGGFEWFGNAPANQLLTAYGLQEFCDMVKVADVDPALIERTARWLAAKQKPSGEWVADPHWFELLPDQIASSNLMSTAFITWSLAESGKQPAATAKGLQYLTAHSREIEDAYTLALVANAQAAAGQVDRALFERLAQMATVDGDLASWGAGRQTAVHGGGDAAKLETTALVTLAFVKARFSPRLTEQALNFLVNKKNSFGTWESTQGTVLALKALTLASSGSFGGESDGSIEVTGNGRTVSTITIAPADADILRQLDLTQFVRDGNNEVQLTVRGNVNVVYQLAGAYYVGWDRLTAAPRPLLDLEVKYDRTLLAVDDTLKAVVTAAYRGHGSAEIVILDLGIPPGFAVMTEDLAGMVEVKLIQSYDLTGRQVIIYVERITADKPLRLEVRMKAKFPVAVSSPRSEAYLYYDPEVRDTVAPVRVEVR